MSSADMFYVFSLIAVGVTVGFACGVLVCDFVNSWNIRDNGRVNLIGGRIRIVGHIEQRVGDTWEKVNKEEN